MGAERSKPRVVVLTHERHGPFEDSGYLLGEMVKLWRRDGVDVTVCYGPDARVEADAAIAHVDLTVLPRKYVDFLRRFPRVLNENVIDISKRLISRNCVRRGDDYTGPVIVKSNRNSGGQPEARLAGQVKGLEYFMVRVRRRMPWSLQAHSTDYRIFSSKREVPALIWLNPDWIVERFLPEQREGFYCLRTWLFLGDRESNSLSYSDVPIIKANTVKKRELVPEVPTALRQMRQDLGFDYGKFDYVIRDGEVVLYDTNRTPYSANMSEQFRARFDMLAEGIRRYL